MTDPEARHVREYLDQNPQHLAGAFAVARAWPAVNHDVCRRFLEHLRDRVEEGIRSEFPAGDLVIKCHYGGDWPTYLDVYRYGWVPYKDGAKSTGGRTSVRLEIHKKGPTDWVWGVRSGNSKKKTTEPETRRRKEVEDALKRHGLSLSHISSWWPQYEKPRHRNWTAIVPELAQELANGGGKITDHYVNGLLGIARKAIPAIDEVELENESARALDDS